MEKELTKDERKALEYLAKNGADRWQDGYEAVSGALLFSKDRALEILNGLYGKRLVERRVLCGHDVYWVRLTDKGRAAL